MAEPIRRQVGVGYKTLVKKTMVQALRKVFTDQYEEEQFKNLRITPEFPLRREHYPAVVIRYSGSTVNNAGVGHEEFFRDPNDVLRWWYHRRFEGTIDFTIYALTPLDRDILSDAIVEILSFGWIDDATSDFFDTFYGDINNPYSILTLLTQITLNTDIITPGGESAGPAPWEPEDTLLYQDSYSVNISGGFYSSIPTDVTELVSDVVIGDVTQEYTSPFIDSEEHSG